MSCDLDRDDFEQAVADRFAQAGGCDAASALLQAQACVSSFLDMENIAFGDPAYAWDRSAAHDLADEEMSCWEACA